MIDKFLNKLKEYSSGISTLEEVEKVYKETGMFFHFYHYIHDKDLREKYDYFAQMHKVELQKFISLLEDKKYKEAAEVHFLGYSE